MHTLGKWFHYRGRKKFKEARFIVAIQLDRQRIFVAKIYGHEGQAMEANAQLIAAAPELLAACKLAIETIETMVKLDKQKSEAFDDLTAWSGLDNPCPQIGMPPVQSILDAIAQAERR